MPPRPRRSTVAPEADPEFLALSTKQRRAIDAAFERGVARSTRRAGKRRRVDDGKGGAAVGSTREEEKEGVGKEDEGGFGVDDAGGFEVDDAGGFEVDDAGGFEVAGGAGGFMEIDDGGGGFMDDGGGFQPEPQPEPTPADDAYAQPSPSTGIPLSKLPPLLAALGLPVDNDVLEVFRASASGWDFDVDTPDRRRKRDDGEPGVERKDFRAVCAALMGPDEDGDASGSDEEGQGGEGDEGGEDVYHLPSEDESSLSDLSSDGARSPGPSRRTRKALESNSTLKLKLDTRQREIARDIWEMLKPDVKEGKRGSSIMGRDEVRQWVRTLGEMWTEDEITDMVGLFSTQHEQRGLSFDDFGTVMLRAGLV